MLRPNTNSEFCPGHFSRERLENRIPTLQRSLEVSRFFAAGELWVCVGDTASVELEIWNSTNTDGSVAQSAQWHSRNRRNSFVPISYIQIRWEIPGH
jgi:hypothetical protein